MNKALRNARLVDTFSKGAIEPVGGGSKEFGKIARTDSEKYGRLVRELNLATN